MTFNFLIFLNNVANKRVVTGVRQIREIALPTFNQLITHKNDIFPTYATHPLPVKMIKM